MLYHRRNSQHTENIQVNGENEKCVFYFIGKKTTYGFFGQPNSLAVKTVTHVTPEVGSKGNGQSPQQSRCTSEIRSRIV